MLRGEDHIAYQFLHFLKYSGAKHNATYRSDIQKVNDPGARGGTMGSFCQDNTIPGLAVCTQGSGRAGWRKRER